MAKRAAAWALAALLLATAGGAAEIQGRMREIDGQRVLHVWGTPFEMGYAQGRILGPEIRDLFAGYILEFVPPLVFEVAADLMPKLFDLDMEYRQEIEGLLAGMEDGGVSTFIDGLGRYLTLWDILAANSLADLRGMACSSISAWGEATEGDPTLAGRLALTRNLDWTLSGPDRTLLARSTVVTAYSPSDPERQEVVSVTFPGFIGCLSCMNESGVVATQNQAHFGSSMLFGLDWDGPFQPINLVLRAALEKRDVDGDGVSTIQDVARAVEDHKRSGKYLVHAVQPDDGRTDLPAEIIETDNAGFAVRYPAHTPEFGTNLMIATNHFLILMPPVPCRRYHRMAEVIGERQGRFTLPAMWDVERQVMQDWRFSTTVHTMTFVPDFRTLSVAYTDDTALAGDKRPAVLTWDALFPEGDLEPPAGGGPEDKDAGDGENEGCGK
jgi:hypothetical protein